MQKECSDLKTGFEKAAIPGFVWVGRLFGRAAPAATPALERATMPCSAPARALLEAPAIQQGMLARRQMHPPVVPPGYHISTPRLNHPWLQLAGPAVLAGILGRELALPCGSSLRPPSPGPDDCITSPV
jgi:hypothetical protein